MFKNTSKLTLLVASGLLTVSVSHANKGAQYQPPPKHSGKGAQYHPPVKKEKENVPHNFYLAGGVNYLLATDNGIPFASITTTVGGSDVANKYYLNPNYQFGYYVGAGYLISEIYDIQASWKQLNTNNTESTSATGPNVVYETGSGFDGGSSLAAGETFTAKTSGTLNYQVLDLTLGQFHDVGPSLNTRVFAGVRYASIVNNVKNSYTAPNAFSGSPFIEKYDSTYNGAGPEFGIDAQYEVWGTLSVVGNFTGAFLVGTVDATSQVPTGVGVYDSISTNSVARVVPAIDTKLGLHAGIPLGDYKDQFFIEAGYELAYYFSVVNEMTANSSALTYNDNFSDVSFNGPYMNFGARF